MGHDVGLHIHPHWIDAKYNGSVWDLSNKSKYCLKDMPKETVTNYFNSCFKVLSDIIYKVKPEYRIKAFRAGGWSVQPFDLIYRNFVDLGIILDFSVLPGLALNEGVYGHYYDYRNAVLNKWAWRFQQDPILEFENGEFVEVPMSTYKISSLLFLLNKLAFSSSKKSISGVGSSRSSFKTKMAKLLRSQKIAAIDDLSTSCFNAMFNAIKVQNSSVITFVGHPKGFSEDTLTILEMILRRCKTISVKNVLEELEM
ncbi:hypothetical protein ACIXT7_05135 [Bacteroides fragilis]